MYRFWPCLKLSPSALNSQVRVGVWQQPLVGRFALPLLGHGAAGNSPAVLSQALHWLKILLLAHRPRQGLLKVRVLPLHQVPGPGSAGAALHPAACSRMTFAWKRPLQTLLCHSPQNFLDFFCYSEATVFEVKTEIYIYYPPFVLEIKYHWE